MMFVEGSMRLTQVLQPWAAEIAILSSHTTLLPQKMPSNSSFSSSSTKGGTVQWLAYPASEASH